MYKKRTKNYLKTPKLCLTPIYSLFLMMQLWRLPLPMYKIACKDCRFWLTYPPQKIMPVTDCAQKILIAGNYYAVFLPYLR
ncbi:hypothetical protein C7N43_28125 [Sphingobacteriales bacterium UPWRP_1]|nr:hypothetical protein B6N25_03190 [Sphingobacteriales bacterium TSM_CSS]PSJ73652.1 hypothetical protein C7N43_28125 [Sphingobacteriales bacterium UPWRP_1]